MTGIYLDHNATTPIAPEALEAITRALGAGLGNPASLHAPGRRARRMLEEAREQILQCVGAGPEDRLIFTSGGTEANNLALEGLGPAGGGVIVSAIEHPSILEPARRMTDRGRGVDFLPVDRSGVVRLAALADRLGEQTGLVSVMAANNETGVVQPIAQIAQLCRGRGVVCHTDGVQALGKLPAGFRELGVDALTVSAHKLHGPPGIGALICRAGIAVRPLLLGGSQQEGIRPGTENVPLAVGMAAALRIWMERRADRITHLAQLRDRFEQRLLDDPAALAVVHGAGVERLPNTSQVAFPGLDRQALLMALDLEGIACSTGSACSSGAAQPSPVLEAMGVPEPLRAASLRFSFGISLTVADVELAAERILRIIHQLRSQPTNRFLAGTISRTHP